MQGKRGRCISRRFIEQADEEEAGEQKPDAAAVKAALEQLQQRRGLVEELQKLVEKEGEVSTVDRLYPEF